MTKTKMLILSKVKSGKTYLNLIRHVPKDIIDLLLETTRQHLVGLIKYEHFNVLGHEGTPVDHVIDTSRCADNHMSTTLQLAHILAHEGASNAGMAVCTEVVPKS